MIITDNCQLPKKVVGLIPNCNGEPGPFEEDKNSYRAGWQDDIGYNLTLEDEYFQFRTGKELDNTPSSGNFGHYTGRGILVELYNYLDLLFINYLTYLQVRIIII